MSQETSKNGRESPQGITRITVQGFKSLYKECSIEIRPLTILAGANSSGKSSIMQPLLLMKQTLEAPFDPGSLLLNGPNLQFTFADQFISKDNASEHFKEFEVRIEINKEIAIGSKFKKIRKQPLEVARTSIEFHNYLLTILPELSRQDLADRAFAIEALAFYYGVYGIRGALLTNSAISPDVIARRCFLELRIEQETEEDITFSGGLNKHKVKSTFWDTSSYTQDFSQLIHQSIHVPGLRNKPDRTYAIAATDSELPGRFEDYFASIIRKWQLTEDQRFQILERQLAFLGLTGKLSAREVNEVQIELLVSQYINYSSSEFLINITDVGFGVSQILPVLVALLVAVPGQLVYLEQPEIHLHPRAQVALAQLLVDAANRGVKVVVETHSELLLLGIQSLVAEGHLLPEKVKLHWFTRREDGITQVSSADLDETGAFGDWPEDFADTSLSLENRYLSAAEARLWERTHDR